MILIFGGTTEGRLAVEVCEQAGKPYYYSTKGGSQRVEMEAGIRLSGTMAAEDITAFCRSEGIRCIIDAAHPFAGNLHQAVAQAGVPVIRLSRNLGRRLDNVVYCRDYADAVKRLKGEGPRCLLALTGVNGIARLKEYWLSRRTLFRILNRPESLDVADAAGFPREPYIL